MRIFSLVNYKKKKNNDSGGYTTFHIIPVFDLLSGVDNEPGRPVSLKDEQYMSSREWLQIYGLDARKLGLYDVLGGVAFKHTDGVIDVMQPPPNDSQTDAVSRK